jgi:hypothetical protein
MSLGMKMKKKKRKEKKLGDLFYFAGGVREDMEGGARCKIG